MSLHLNRENLEKRKKTQTDELKAVNFQEVQPYLNSAAAGILKLRVQFAEQLKNFPNLRDKTLPEMLELVVARLQSADSVTSKDASKQTLERAITGVIQRAGLKDEERQAVIEFYFYLINMFEHVFDSVHGALEKISQNEDLVHADILSFAKLNQRLCLFLIESSYSNQPQDKQLANLFMQFLDMMTHRETGEEKTIRGQVYMQQFLNGVRSQTAVIRAALDNNCSVLVPDRDDEQELSMWEIAASTDMLIIDSEGRLTFIDVVSSIKWNTPGTQDSNPLDEDRFRREISEQRNLPPEKRQRVEAVKNTNNLYPVHLKVLERMKGNENLRKQAETNQNLRKFFERLDRSKTMRFTWKVITLPGHSNYLSTLGEQRLPDHRQSLADLLDQELKQSN